MMKCNMAFNASYFALNLWIVLDIEGSFFFSISEMEQGMQRILFDNI